MKKYPFKFLDSYNQNDTDIFFGRDEEVNALYEMIFQHSILLVYGGSGTGKTSLIQCGLAGKFKSYDWLALMVRRGSNINASLEKSLTDAGGNDVVDEDEIASENEKTLTGLPKLIKGVYQTHFKPVYLIFDQFEELYILGTKEEATLFIESVKQILASEQPVKMIFSIREEYLGYLFDFERAVPQLLRKKLRVEPMTIDNLTDVLTGINNFKNSNVRIKTEELAAITEGIFNRLRGKKNTLTIQLPYLQVFFDKLYMDITHDESRQADALVTNETLLSMGDIGDVLRDFLEDQVKTISQKQTVAGNNIPVDTIWKILSPFATLKGTKEPIEKKELQNRLKGIDEKLLNDCIEAFVSHRIMNFNEATNTYELAHDSLAKCIAEKRSDEDIALLEIRRLINNQVAIKAEAREPFTAKQLNIIEPYLNRIELTAEEKELIKQSRKEVERLRNAEKRKRMAKIAGSLISLAIAASVAFGVNLYNKKITAKKTQQESLARFKALAKKSIEKENKLQAYLYIIEALQLEKDTTAYDSLVTEASKARRLPLYSLNKMLLHNSVVVRAAFAPGDTSIYTWSSDGLLNEWNLQTGSLIRKVKFELKNDDEGNSELINPHTTILFSQQNNNSLTVADTVLQDSSVYFKKMFSQLYEPDATGLPGFPEIIMKIRGANYSADKKMEITWGKNTESIYDAVDIWDEDGINIGPSLVHDGIYGAAISKDNSMILTWGSDSTARIWRTTKVDTGIFKLNPELMKLKAQLQTGVEVSPSDQTLKIIYPEAYIKKQEEFKELLDKVRGEKKN
ncbi:hypothetical protein BH11BAC3_BH11BAC3_27630 [soil metagenome]